MKLTAEYLLGQGYTTKITPEGEFFLSEDGRVALVRKLKTWVPCRMVSGVPQQTNICVDTVEELNHVIMQGFCS